jgi:hypothetical protein
MTTAATHATLPAAACGHLLTLERVLRGQLEGWRRLLGVIERQREAIRSANGAALEQAAQEQRGLTRTLGMLDQQRVRVTAALHEAIAPGEPQSPSLLRVLDLAAEDEEQRMRLMTLARDLRDTIDTAKRRGAVVRQAAEGLANHIAGIQQTAHSALSRARVYERRGRLNPGAALPAAVDLKS